MKIVLNKIRGVLALSEEAMLYLVKKNSSIIKKINRFDYLGDHLYDGIRKVGKLIDGKYHYFSYDLIDDEWAYTLIDSRNTRVSDDLIEVVEKFGELCNVIETFEPKIVEIDSSFEEYNIDEDENGEVLCKRN